MAAPRVADGAVVYPRGRAHPTADERTQLESTLDVQRAEVARVLAGLDEDAAGDILVEQLRAG